LGFHLLDRWDPARDPERHDPPAGVGAAKDVVALVTDGKLGVLGQADPGEVHVGEGHDRMPRPIEHEPHVEPGSGGSHRLEPPGGDRKSTRLNSSHEWISYAVFCLKKN